VSSIRKKAAVERRAKRAFFTLLFGLAFAALLTAMYVALWR